MTKGVETVIVTGKQSLHRKYAVIGYSSTTPLINDQNNQVALTLLFLKRNISSSTYYPTRLRFALILESSKDNCPFE
jgi:hypothetical protein